MGTRRNFFFALPLLFIACITRKKTEEVPHKNNDADAGKNLISEGHPIAKTFRYRMDGTTPSANMGKSIRNGVPPEQQLCKNCLYYTPIGDDYGSCQMLPQGNVTVDGWCFAWAPKKIIEMPTG